MSSVPSKFQSLPCISCHHTSRYRGYSAKHHCEDKDSHGEPKGVPLEWIAAISPHESPVGRIRLRFGMQFSKPISPVEEVHQMKLLGCIEGTTKEEILVCFPEICLSTRVPIREKKSQR